MDIKDFSIQANEVHLWRAPLTINTADENIFLSSLSTDEKIRAERFHFPQHRRRFIAARGLLRKLLSYYQHTQPEKIIFQTHLRGKPYLANTSLQFNVSHSDEMAVFAVTNNFSIGVDIEKIKQDFNAGVAERYFHPDEYTFILSLPEAKQAAEFYRIWSRKEAWVKALGEGLHYKLSSFSVLEDKPMGWHIESFAAHPDYQSAFAAQHDVGKVCYFEWVDKQPLLLRSF